jgi:Tar-like ligand binding protein
MGAMRGMKLVLTGLVALIVVLGLGFAWGSSGRVAAQRAVEDTKQQLDLAEARGRLLEARVSLYNVNFGDAQRQFEDAKTPLTRARDRYQQDGKRGAAEGISAALAHIQEAQRLAAKLDPNANNQASEALKAIQVATSR